MLTNYHTHTTFCDGKNTPEEIVLYAIDKGFSSIGFSGHGHTPFDVRYCMTDTTGYIEEISRMKDKYGKKIEIYCGVEEDAFAYVDRQNFDYIIGSSHYLYIKDKYYPIDSGYDYFERYMEAFDNNVLKVSEAYYSTFVSYIKKRKPDIVGHFDLITKYEESGTPYFFNNEDYWKIAEKYLRLAAETDVVFEVNAGAMTRGIRTTPYLGQRLLYVLKEKEGKVILSSDSHKVETLDAYFDEMKCILRDVGFNHVYEFSKGKFVKRFI